MIYKPSPYERTNIGDMEYSLLELLLKYNEKFQDLKLTSDMFFDENISKIIAYADEQNKFDTNDIVAKSKTDNNFVSFSFIQNMLFRDNDFIYNFERYQKPLLENYKAYKINQLIHQKQKVTSQEDIDALSETIEYYRDLTISQADLTEQIGSEALEKLYDENPDKDVISTGYKNLDNMIKGFRLKTMTIIGANPSVGKTAFALNLMWNILKNGYDVTFFSLEMPGVDVFERLASRVKRIQSRKIRDKNLTVEEIENISTLFNTLRNHKYFHINDGSNITTREIRKAAATESDKPKVIFIDHLSFIKPLNEKVDMRIRIAETSRQLTTIAKEYNVAIVCLAQLSRSNKQRQDKRPEMSDLQESGNIEQDANTILLLHRDDYHDIDSMDAEVSDTKIIVAKNRDGNRGTVSMTFHKGVQTFYEN